MRPQLTWLPLAFLMIVVIAGTQTAIFLFWKQILPFWFLGGILAGAVGGFATRDWRHYAIGAVCTWFISSAGVAVVTVAGSGTDLPRNLFYFVMPVGLMTPMMLAIFGILGLFLMPRDSG